jgi:hypothetical protein
MKTRTFTFTAVAALAALLIFSGSGLAARKTCDDGSFPPCADTGSGMEPPDYGDLIILYRDIDGVPIPSPETTAMDPDGLPAPGGLCWQPLAFNFSVPAEPEDLCPADCVVASEPGDTGTAVVDVVDVNQYNCGVAEGCSGCTQEVDFGRINAVRSPDDVFDRQLQDVIVNLTTADCVTLDPAGRMVASRVADDGTVSSSAIDSPLQNLAITRQLLLTGTIGAPLPQGAGVLDTAARGIGAGSSKTGEVNVDLVAYLDQLMGLTAPGTVTILDPKLCETYREEVQGVIQLVEKCFLNYGAVPPNGNAYAYRRGANFTALPAPAYIDDPLGSQDMPGWFEYLAEFDTSVPSFTIAYGPIMNAVFADDVEEGNIGGYARAADDARAVINFMHDWPMPDADVYATPVPCLALGDIDFDVSISDVSGLQVPKNIVDGSSDREFIVNVANAGPDDATVTLTVTAIPDAGGTVEANLDGDDPDAGFIPSPFVFEPIVIAAGTSHSFSALISVEIGTQTTINWTAVAAAPGDVLLGNNTATAVSNVKVTGSGGGGGNGGNGGQGGNPN